VEMINKEHIISKENILSKKQFRKSE